MDVDDSKARRLHSLKKLHVRTISLVTDLLSKKDHPSRFQKVYTLYQSSMHRQPIYTGPPIQVPHVAKSIISTSQLL